MRVCPLLNGYSGHSANKLVRLPERSGRNRQPRQRPVWERERFTGMRTTVRSEMTIENLPSHDHVVADRRREPSALGRRSRAVLEGFLAGYEDVDARGQDPRWGR